MAAKAFAFEANAASETQPGPAHAAILLLAMGSTGAAKVLKHLTPDEIKVLTRTAASLEPVSRDRLEDLVLEFQDAFKSGPGLSGPARQMTELLQSSLTPEEYAAVAEEQPVFQVDANTLWDEVERLDAKMLSATLGREHPQVAATALTSIASAAAAPVVMQFEPVFRNEVMRRMLTVKPLATPVRRVFETQIRQSLLSAPGKAGGNGKHAALAEIVNRMDKRQGEELLVAIAATSPEDALALRNLLFSFDDLIDLPQKARFVIFDEIPADVVTMALNGAAPEMRECVLSSLAARARRMVEAELNQASGARAGEVDAARRTIASTALRLAGEGKIELRPAEAP